MRRLSVLAAAVFAFAAAGCDDDDEGEGAAAAEGTYVGTVEGTDAYIALVSDGERVAGYVCDGTPQGGANIEFWFDDPAKVTDGSAELVSPPRARAGIEASFEDDEASGEVRMAGGRTPFSAEAASGEAGLYRAARGEPRTEGSAEAGWIVLADGSQRGCIGIFPVGGGPAPILDPIADNVEIRSPRAGTLQVSQIRDPDQF